MGRRGNLSRIRRGSRGRLRAVAALRPCRGRRPARALPRERDGRARRRLVGNAPRGRGRAEARTRGPAGSGASACGRRAAGRARDRRHEGELAARRLARPHGRPRPRGLGGLRAARDERARPPGARDRGQQRRRCALRRLRAAEADGDTPAARLPGGRVGAAPALSPARPLGQPEPHHRARLRRLLALGLAEAARLHGPALSRLRARERLDRHQRQRDHERQRQRHQPHRRVAREGGGARLRLPALRHPRLPDGPLQRADRDRRPQDRRPARPRGGRVVDAQGRRDLPLHPGLRRLPGEGQLRGPAGAAGLQAQPRRRRQRARRRARPARRHRDVAGLRLLERGARRPRQAGLQRVQAARRLVPQERDGAGEERRRSTSSRASPSTRSSARCRRRLS